MELEDELSLIPGWRKYIKANSGVAHPLFVPLPRAKACGSAHARKQKIPLLRDLLCGVGGIRTLVQTSNYNAFYMLSFQLIFDVQLTGNSLIHTYPLKFW